MTVSTLFIGIAIILLFIAILLLWEGINAINFSMEIKKYIKDLQNYNNNMVKDDI